MVALGGGELLFWEGARGSFEDGRLPRGALEVGGLTQAVLVSLLSSSMSKLCGLA